MFDNLLLIIGLIIAFINIYFALPELITIHDNKDKLNRKNLSFVIALSIVSGVYIYTSIKSIGLVSLLISMLTTLLIFLISISIFQDEDKKGVGTKQDSE